MGIVALWTPCHVFKTCSDLYTVPVIIPPLLMCPVKTMNLLSCPAQNSLLEESNISHCRRQTHPSFCVKLKRLNGTRLVKHRNRWFWALLDTLKGTHQHGCRDEAVNWNTDKKTCCVCSWWDVQILPMKKLVPVFFQTGQWYQSPMRVYALSTICTMLYFIEVAADANKSRFTYVTTRKVVISCVRAGMTCVIRHDKLWSFKFPHLMVQCDITVRCSMTKCGQRCCDHHHWCNWARMTKH